MVIFTGIVVLLVVCVYFFIHSAPFGALPAGNRLERIKRSPNYRQQRFQNQHFTPNLVEGVGFARVFFAFFFGKDKRNRPPAPLPSVRTNLQAIAPEDDLLVWFGHSSYFLQVDGKKILVDPVFSGHASPIPFTNRSYPGTNVYTAEEMPLIDYLVITHDHWDHLDYQTVVTLQPKVRQVVTSLGTGAHLERWGYAPGLIHELDWNESFADKDFVFTGLPARHFSGRGFTRDQSIWLSFSLQTPSRRIYLGGDSGYDTHFAEIGRSFGPFDLAILECGQYNLYWKYIHMLPEEVVQAGIDLRAGKILPVHWGKFSLSIHAWDEPIERVTAEAERKQQTLLTPMIGDVLTSTAIRYLANGGSR